MKPYRLAIAALAATASLAAVAAAPMAATISVPEAGKIADTTAAAWASMDAERIKALYAPSVVAFDFMVAPLETDRAAFDKAQELYAAEKIDRVVQKERTIQILDAETFIVSGSWEGTSTATPANNGLFRCTDVYRRDKNAKWLIVNEHCSAAPKPA